MPKYWESADNVELWAELARAPIVAAQQGEGYAQVMTVITYRHCIRPFANNQMVYWVFLAALTISERLPNNSNAGIRFGGFGRSQALAGRCGVVGKPQCNMIGEEFQVPPTS